MPETQTPEAPPEENSKKSEKKAGSDGASTSVTPAQRKREIEKHFGKENKDGDATTNISPEVREKIRQELLRESSKYEETPWQQWRKNVAPPAKTAAKVGLFVANPIVYGTVYGADWLAQRTPGVKNLYAKPREIIRSTANEAMNVLVGGATLLPALPQTVAHEVSDKLHGMDTSKPKNAIGWAIDTTGDVIADTFKLLKAVLGKTVDGGKKVIPEVLKAVGTIVFSPLKLIGSAYKGLGQIGGVTGLVGQVLLTAALVSGGHAAASAVLPYVSLAAFDSYIFGVNVLRGVLCQVIPIPC